MRWYVWTRGRSGKRKVRIETYLAQMARAGRTVHAANVLKTAKSKGYDEQKEQEQETARKVVARGRHLATAGAGPRTAPKHGAVRG